MAVAHLQKGGVGGKAKLRVKIFIAVISIGA